MNPQERRSFIQNLHPLFITLLILVICFLTYSNCLNNDFLMDDYPLLVKNPSIGSIQFLQMDLSNNGHGQAYFRPVERILRFINFSMFADQPTGYHLVNLALFFLGCLSLYQLVLFIFKDKPLAILTAVLFAAHPINGIVVNYKNATYFALFFLAMNVSILQFLNGIEKRSKFSYTLSFFWLALALLSHETTIAYPLFLAAILYCGLRKSFKETVLLTLPAVIFVGMYVLLRFFFFSMHESVIANIGPMGMTFFGYTAALAKVIGWYISKLIVLKGILMVWTAEVLPSEVFLWNAILVTGVICAIILGLSSKRTDPARLAILWFLAGLLPLSFACFSRPLFGFAIEPHWLLSTSVGFFLFLAAILLKLREKINPKIWLVVILVILVSYIAQSRHNNHLWGSQERYCRYWLSISPDSYWANFWLAYDRMENKDYPEAVRHFKRILSGTTLDAGTYFNLGFIEFSQKNWDEAAFYYAQSLRFDPNNAATYYWLGCAQLNLGITDKARACFKKAIELDGSVEEFRRKLEQTYR